MPGRLVEKERRREAELNAVGLCRKCGRNAIEYDDGICTDCVAASAW